MSERGFSKPREVKLRRYGVQRLIPGFDTVEGSELIKLGKQEFVFLGVVDAVPKIPLNLEEDVEGKQRFNYFSRDADFDGDVQDGTPHQRRSRSLTHLIFSRRLTRPSVAKRSRLRDLPVDALFPAGPSKPTPNVNRKPKNPTAENWPTKQLQDRRVKSTQILTKAKAARAMRSIGDSGQIGSGKISIDSPGVRSALSRGAVVDGNGSLRCPPGTPGAMQFTNWRMENCSNPRKMVRTKIQLTADELSQFTAGGGRVLNSAEVTKYQAEVRGETVGSTRNVRNRKRLAARVRQQKDPKTNKSTGGLAELLNDNKRKTVRIDLATGEAPTSGLAMPRPEASRNLDLNGLVNFSGNVTDDGAAAIIQWLDEVMDEPGRPGAISSMATISQVLPPGRPYDVQGMPLNGRAQDIADRADGDFAKFMKLLDDEELVFFDFETTGFDAGDGPVQVALVRVKNGKVLERQNFYMNPERPLGGWSSENLKDSSGKNLVTDEWLATQMPLEDGLHKITEFIGDSIVVAHNSHYDVRVLRDSLREKGIDFNPSGSIDTLTLSRQLIPKSESRSHSLDGLAKFFDITTKDWHNAKDDAETTVKLWNKLRARTKKTGGDSRILDKAHQEDLFRAEQERFAREMEEYPAKLAAYRDKWGTDAPVAKLDVFDIFDERSGRSKKEQKEALDNVLDLADQEGTSMVLRLSDGATIRDGEIRDIPTSSPEDLQVEPRARIQDTTTRLDAATSKLAREDSMNLDAFTQEQIESMLTELKKLPGFTWVDEKNPDHLWLAVDQGANNLYSIADSATPEEVARWRRWYEAANKFAQDVGERHGVSTTTSAAVIAVLSPTKDWNSNIAMADHAAKLYHDKDFTIDEDLAGLASAVIAVNDYKKKGPGGAIDKKIATQRNNIKKAEDKIVNLRTAAAPQSQVDTQLAAIKKAEQRIAELEAERQAPSIPASDLAGKSIRDFDFDVQAVLVSTHAKHYGASYMGQPEIGKGKALRNYAMDVDSDGNFTTAAAADKVSIQSLGQYEKALRILAADKNGKPDLRVIDEELGRGSKVRSFFGNILGPNDEEYKEITADTHHFGAATLVPVSAAHQVLDAIFKPSGASGASAAYPIFRAMTVLAASRWNSEKGDDLLPRAMQSVAWERIRQIVPTSFPNPKNPSKNTKDSSLKSSITNTFAQIARLTGGPTPKRKDLVGRQVELLQELSLALQAVPKGEKRAQVLADFRKKYKLSKLLDVDILERDVRKEKDKVYEVDKETGERNYLSVNDLTENERRKLGLDSSEPAKAEVETKADAIKKKNKEILEQLKAFGGSFFESNEQVKDGTRTYGTTQERIQSQTKAIEWTLNKLRESFDSLRTREEPVPNDFSFENLWLRRVEAISPEIADLISNSTNEELFEILRNRSVEFHKGFSKNIQVNMPTDRFNSFLDSKQYLTTHFTRSNHSGADMRRAYEATIGIPNPESELYGPFTMEYPNPQKVDQLRPASGYAVHKDIEQAAIAEAKKIDPNANEFSPIVEELGFNGLVKTYGNIVLKLRPEVAERSGYGRGDSLNTQLLPTRFDETDPDKIMLALLSADKKEADSLYAQIFSLLDSHVRDSFEMMNNDSAFRTNNEDKKAFRSNYFETLILGSFTLDEVEEIVIRHEEITRPNIEPGREAERNFWKNQFSSIAEEFFTTDKLRQMGLSEEEVAWVLDQVNNSKQKFNNADLGSPQYYLPSFFSETSILKLLDVRRAKKIKEQIESNGVKLKVTHPANIEYFDPEGWNGKKGMDVEDVVIARFPREIKKVAERAIRQRNQADLEEL